LNTLIGGASSDIFLIIGDIGGNSGSGLDFINGMTWIERFYVALGTSNSAHYFDSMLILDDSQILRTGRSALPTLLSLALQPTKPIEYHASMISVSFIGVLASRVAMREQNNFENMYKREQCYDYNDPDTVSKG
jgi:hypothetical protein